MVRFRLAVLSAAMLFAFAAAADDAAINSAPRTIDVVVTDSHGTHLTGLTRSDFTILENGQPRDVARFAAFERAADGSDPQPRRYFLLVVDETSISLAARRTIVAALKEFVDTRVRPIDKVMVVTIVGVGGVLPATSWTSNKAELNAALDKTEQSTIGNKGYERNEIERHIQTAISYAQQGNANSQQLITFDFIMQPARQYAGIMEQEAHAAAGAVNDALSFLGNGPGKKVAVIAGGGLSTRPGSDIFQYMESLRQQATLGYLGQALARGSQQANPLSEASRYDMTDMVRGIAKSAHDRGIVVYAIDPDNSGSGVNISERKTATDNSEEFAGMADRLSGYQLLSSVTGGLTMTSRGSVPISEIASDLDSHYLLTYTQTLTPKGAVPKVDVKVARPGARLRLAFTGGPATKEAEVQDAVIANHLASPVSNDLQITLKNEEPLPDAEGRRVRLRVLIPVKSLKFEQEGRDVTGAFAVFVSTGDEKGNASAINRQVHDIRWPADQLPQMIDKTFGFNVEVVLKPGRNQISVGVIDERSKQTGFAKTSI
jgi:VWFA-related protein